METEGRTPGRDRIAIAASIALHLCAVIALAVVVPASVPTDDPDERTLLATTIRIVHRPPARVSRVRRTLVVTAGAPKQAPRPVVHLAVAVAHSTRALVVAAEDRSPYAGTHPEMRSHATDPNPGLTPVQPAVEDKQPNVDVTPTPAPAPTASPAPTAMLASRDEGIGNFDETYPASIEPTLRSSLIAIAGGFDVRIAVDESGHATAIEFKRSPADAALREELRERLLAARFIPATCNGLRCAGSLELKN